MAVPYLFAAGAPQRPGAQLDANFAAVANGSASTVTVVTTAGDVVMGAADFYVVIDKTVPAATQVTLPANPGPGRLAIVQDGSGSIDIGVDEITVVGAGGEQINGSSSLIMNSPYACTTFRFTGTKWLIVF